LLFAQKCGEVFTQRVKPNVFGRNQPLLAGGLLSLARSASDVDPVCRLVASALVPLEFDEGLKQRGLETIPYVRQRADRDPQEEDDVVLTGVTELRDRACCKPAERTDTSRFCPRKFGNPAGCRSAFENLEAFLVR
jgi:hypothetical protein